MRATPFAVACGLFAVGLVSGSLLDPRPERPALERGGWRVLAADFHVHTRLSDGFLSPLDVVVQAERRGLDAFALTEHNTLLAARLARWYSRAVDGPTVVLGEEVTTRRFHVIGIGLTEAVSWDQPLEAVIAQIHGQGGVVIAAHPVGRFSTAFESLRAQLDAAEVMHPIVFNSTGGGRGWNWSEMREFYERARSDGYALAAIGSSDYHFFSPLGVCRTWVFAADDSAAAIVEAVRAGRTVVYGLDGEVWGDPALMALLEADPLPEVDWDYNYNGVNAVDRVTRVLGWLGAIGLLFLGPARWGSRRRS